MRCAARVILVASMFAEDALGACSRLLLHALRGFSAGNVASRMSKLHTIASHPCCFLIHNACLFDPFNPCLSANRAAYEYPCAGRKGTQAGRQALHHLSERTRLPDKFSGYCCAYIGSQEALGIHLVVNVDGDVVAVACGPCKLRDQRRFPTACTKLIAL